MSSVYSCDLHKGEASLTTCAGLVIDVFASKSAAVFLDAGLYFCIFEGRSGGKNIF